jgi:hypothetical protein
MKKLTTVVLALLTCTFVYAQKVDLDRFNFQFSYRDLPANPLNPEYRSYSVTVNASSAVRNNYGDTGIQDAVNIEGWKKITEGKGHVIVAVTLGDLVISKSEVTERVDIQKDKDGKETGRKYYYKAEATYAWEGSASIKDYKDASISSTSLGSSSSKTWTSSEYSSRKEAQDYYNNNRNEIKAKLIRDEVNSALSATSNWLSTNYGYPVKKDYEILWLCDSKKHPETVAQKENWEKFKAAVATITPETTPDDAKAKFQELIKYFDSVVAKYTTDDKSDKKLRYSSYYNKAKIYMYLDNPEAAIKEAEDLILNGYDDGDGKRIKKEALALIEAFKKNNTNTRHFVIDLSGVSAPAGTN